MAKISTAMLSGYVAIPCNVSGVTTAPSDMPISTKMARINNVGISIGRPASDAPATARIEPDSQPAGTPMSPSAAPPAAARASVSARWRTVVKRSVTDDADKTRALREPSAPCAEAHRMRSMPRAGARVKYWLLCRHRGRRRVNVAAAEDDTHQIGGISGTDLLHDACAVHFDRARADAETATDFLVRCTLRNLG